MLKNLKLSSKLWGLTALLLLAVLVVAGNSLWSISGLLSSNKNYVDTADSNTFMVEKEVDHLNWINKVQDMFMNNRETLNVEVDHTKCGLGKFLYGKEAEEIAGRDSQIAGLLDGIKEPHKRLHDSASLIKDSWKQRHKGLTNLLKDRLDDHRKWAANAARIVLERNADVDLQLDHTLCAFGKFLASNEYAEFASAFPALRDAMEAVKEPHRQLHESAHQIKEAVRTGQQEKAESIYKTVTMAKLEDVDKHFTAAIDMEGALEKAQADAMDVFEAKTLPALGQTREKMTSLISRFREMAKSSQTQMEATGSRSQWAAVVVTVVAAVLGIVLGFFVIRSITKPINEVIENLSDGADQVAAASGQVSSASQSLAEGSSEQAASLEETSSSLEEMSSMTKQNAENAGQADNLMKEANRMVAKANESMNQLTGSMQEISKASEETSKIIKTIDEIAFQTNLLALNAAVEAARAGEAGAGFAVVADEVRNLAMRAADAAKNTANLIDGTVKKVKDGTEIVTHTNEAFLEVAQSATKVGELVAEIAAASNEQAQGISQVNTAVAEMDKVVQATAANAEESASASEELNAQAEQMKGNVGALMALVRGTDHTVRAGETPGPKRIARAITKTLPASMKKAKTKASLGSVNSNVNPEEILPMHDSEFKDF